MALRRAVILLAAWPGVVAAQGVVVGTVGSSFEPVSEGVVQFFPLDVTQPAVSADTVVMDQRRLRFIPSVLPIQIGTTVEFINSDPVMHNVFGLSGGQGAFNLGTYPRNESRFSTFGVEGAQTILCHVHPEMVAWILAVATPYFTVTGEDGSFEMRGLPAGQYEVHVWHRRLGIWEAQDRVRVPTDGQAELSIRNPRARARHPE